MDNSTKVGKITGTGAAINVSLGFVPDYVRIVADDGSKITEWFKGFADGTAVSITAAGTAAVAAPGGVAPFYGQAPNQPRGFTIGASTSVTGKNLFYFAARTSSGV